MAEKNASILGSVWLSQGNDYQQLVPEPTQANMAQQAAAIFDPMNTRIYNLFMDSLVNRIGKSFISQNKQWNNPLLVFDKGVLPFGYTVQEIATKFIKAHSYMDDKETLLKLHRPEAQACYHSVDFQNYYPVSVNRSELEMAFADEYGLNELINNIFVQPINSANYDIYNSMMEAIAYAEQEWGLRKVHVSAVSDKATGQALLAEARAVAGEMAFPSCLFNAGVVNDIPVFSRPDELVMLVTPRVKAYLDVYALADLFHLDKADIKYRVVEVREFPIAGVQAMLCDESFFQYYTKVWDTQTFWNPETLSETYFLHAWMVLSVSPFANCVLFTTAAGTDVSTITIAPSGIDLTTDATSNTIPAGGTCRIIGTLQGEVTDNDFGIELKPDSFTWQLSASGATLNSRTYIDQNGILHTQKSLPTGASITVTGTSTYVNPSGSTSTYTDTVTVYIDNAPEAKITAFSLPVGTSGASVSGVIDQTAGTIAVAAVAGTTVTSLAATFTASEDATVKVGSTTQTSGTTTNNFTSPVKYKVINGEITKEYTVTVTVAES